MDEYLFDIILLVAVVVIVLIGFKFVFDRPNIRYPFLSALIILYQFIGSLYGVTIRFCLTFTSSTLFVYPREHLIFTC